jgi:hypothetical protein
MTFGGRRNISNSVEMNTDEMFGLKMLLPCGAVKMMVPRRN